MTGDATRNVSRPCSAPFQHAHLKSAVPLRPSSSSSCNSPLLLSVLLPTSGSLAFTRYCLHFDATNCSILAAEWPRTDHLARDMSPEPASREGLMQLPRACPPRESARLARHPEPEDVRKSVHSMLPRQRIDSIRLQRERRLRRGVRCSCWGLSSDWTAPRAGAEAVNR